MSGQSTNTSGKKNKNKNRRRNNDGSGIPSGSSGPSSPRERRGQEPNATGTRSPGSCSRGEPRSPTSQANAAKRVAMAKRDKQGIQSPIPTTGKDKDTNDAKLTKQVNDNTPSQSTGKGGSYKRGTWIRGGQQKPEDHTTEPVATPETVGMIQRFQNMAARTLRSAGGGPTKIPKDLVPTNLRSDLIGGNDHIESSVSGSPDLGTTSDPTSEQHGYHPPQDNPTTGEEGKEASGTLQEILLDEN